ncbi:MAG TPA: neutral zinc metallopeptidase [Beijerinckiaceae bacterium]|nr:neutral zinc metallopeptidase [Beijerinckiaceae bacterium]
MRWEDFRPSEYLEDRRGDGGGGGGGIPMGRGGLGIGTMIILGIVGWALGIDPRILISGVEMMQGGGSPQYEQPSQAQRRQQGPPQDQMGRFAAAVLGNTEDVWKDIFPKQVNKQYTPPRMVLFSGATRSRCGAAQSAMGPFYCPLDQTVYIDLSFFQEMQRRFRAGGDFAYAYVIAHEVGHHVENQLGLLARVQQRQQEVGRTEANQLSVRVELMADCLAGIWASQADQRFKAVEPGDVEEAMKAAEAIGDDRLQQQSQGRVVPDSFTHGSSEQRMRWFMTGFKSGQVQACDTFRASRV